MEKKTYTADIDKLDGSPSIVDNTGNWYASFATAEDRDAVLELLIQKEELA